MKIINLIIYFILLVAAISFAQSTVYRDISSEDLEDKLSAGIDKLEKNENFWFVYSTDIIDGPQIQRYGGIHYSTSDDSDDEHYRIENVIKLSEIPGNEPVALLENKSFDRQSRSSKYFMIFEYVKNKFKEFHVSNNTDGFDFKGNEIIYAGQSAIAESYQFTRSIFDDLESDNSKEDMVFALYLHKELQDVVDFLKDLALDAEYKETAEQAIFWIGNIDKKETPQFLMDIYNDVDNADLKEKVIFALSINETNEATDFLINIAMNDDDRDMRKQALFWIGHKASDKTLGTLQDVVEKDDDVEVKKSAVFALSQMETEEATATLIDIARSNPYKKLRKAAIFWLSQSDNPKAAEFLVSIVKE